MSDWMPPSSGGGSAQQESERLRAQAAAARAQADALDGQARAWAAGAAGERAVAQRLATLPETFHVLHDRLLDPTTSLANLDHLVTGPAGVFLVDAKNWAGQFVVHGGTLWQYRPGASDPVTVQGELSKIESMAHAASARLGGAVTPVMALTGNGARDFQAQFVGNVWVTHVDALTGWLTSQPANASLPGSDAVAVLAGRVQGLFPTASDPSLLGPRPQQRLSRAVMREKGMRMEPRRRGGCLSRLFWLLVIAVLLVVLAINNHLYERARKGPDTGAGPRASVASLALPAPSRAAGPMG